MCCFLRIHFSIPLSNRRFLTSDRLLSQSSQATPRSQFSNFDHSHRSTFVSSKGIISNSTVYIHIIVPKASNTYRTRSDTLRTRRFETLSFHDPWTIPIHSPFHGTMIHPSLSKGKQKSPLFLHHTRVFPRVIHPRLTVPGQLRNARKAYGPGMVHARSLQLLSPAAHLDLHFSLSSALSLVTPMTGRSEDPPAREKKYARRVRKVARNTPRCLRAPDAPVPLPPRQWRNSRGAPRSRGREELEGRRTRTFRIVRVFYAVARRWKVKRGHELASGTRPDDDDGGVATD